jgi:ParB-like chromosome segregation protein Spo0J
VEEEGSFAESVKRLREEAGKAPVPSKPVRLRLKEIRTAERAFQPRDIETAWLALDSHVKALTEAVKNAEGNAFDPITVWWSGLHWYVIDGHHRMKAYLRAKKEDEKLKIETVPVNVFEGTIELAIQEAVTLNSKDKLPMSKADKLERAWKLVCLNADGMTKEQIVKATTVSERTVANMRRERRTLLQHGEADLLALTWVDVLAHGRPASHDDEWQERQAIQWQKRLVKHFGKKFAEQPEIAARALELYSARLPEELVRLWPEEARRAVQEDEELEF